MYLLTKFQASSIILTIFRQGVILLSSPHTLKRTLKKPTQIRVKRYSIAKLFWEISLNEGYLYFAKIRPKSLYFLKTFEMSYFLCHALLKKKKSNFPFFYDEWQHAILFPHSYRQVSQTFTTVDLICHTSCYYRYLFLTFIVCFSSYLKRACAVDFCCDFFPGDLS